jgi:hypothetical protein
VTDYVDHYNRHRPHRALDQRSPSTTHREPIHPAAADVRQIRRQDVLDGLIHEYRPVA